MAYYNKIENRDRNVALMYVAGFTLLLIVSLFVVNFTVTEKFTEYPPREGVLVAFGDMVEGYGERPIQRTNTPTPVPPKPTATNTTAPTATRNDVPTPSLEVTETKVNEAAEDAVLKSSSESAQKTPTVNQSALYSANTGSTATSIGLNKGQEGTMGSSQGSPDSQNHTITDGFSLNGRSIIGSLPRPQYTSDSEGRVVIDIRVNKSGEVTSATFRANSSTTNDTKLVQEAINAALKARFNVDPNANFIQAGTITYIFKVQ